MSLSSWRGPSGLAGCVLIAASVVLRGVSLHKGYYAQDDFLMFARAVDAPLDLPFLMQDYGGHLFPGGFLWTWLDVRLARMNWDLSLLPVLGALTLVAVLGWMVVTRLLGESWWRIPILTVLVLCPLPLWSTQWWAVAIQYLPVTILVLLAILAHLRWRDRPRLAAVSVSGALVGALAFQERGLLIIPTLGLLALATAEGTWRRRMALTVRRDWLSYASLAAIAAGYLVLHSRLVPPEDVGRLSISDQFGFAGNVLVQNANVGLWGGPWAADIPFYGVVRAVPWVVVVAALATAVLWAWTIRRGGRDAAWAWSVVIGVTTVNTILLLAGRSGFGDYLAFVPRYTADLVVPLVVSLALVVRALRLEGMAWWRPTLVGVAYAASALGTWGSVLPTLLHTPDREYVTNARAELRANPNVVLVDASVPEDLMRPIFGYDARASIVLAAAPEHPAFDLPTREFRMLDGAGHLVDATLVETVQGQPGVEPCGYAVTNKGSRIDLEQPVTDMDRRLLRLTYYTDTATTATITFGDTRQQAVINRGADPIELIVTGPADHLTVEIDNPTSTLCVASAEVGRAYPGRG